MLKKILLLLSLLIPFAAAWAAVDVNTATEAQLQELKGIGPVRAHAIVQERDARGPFKDSNDLVTRIKGIGPKSIVKLQEQGLTVGGGTFMPDKTATTAKSHKTTTAATSATTGAASDAATTKPARRSHKKADSATVGAGAGASAN